MSANFYRPGTLSIALVLMHLDYVSRLFAESGNTSENTLVTQANACVFSADAAVISAL